MSMVIFFTATEMATALEMDPMAFRAWLRRFEEDIDPFVPRKGREYTFVPADLAVFATVRRLMDANVLAVEGIRCAQKALRGEGVKATDGPNEILKRVRGKALAMAGTKASVVKQVPIEGELTVVVGLEPTISAAFKRVSKR